MKQYLPGLALVAAIAAVGCALNPVETGPVVFNKKPKKVVEPEQVEPKSAAWTPPATQLPKEYVSSVQFLLAHGMADPRRGTFSRINFMPLGGRGSTNCYGWVYTESDGRKKFIGMDGVSRYLYGGGKPVKIDDVAVDPGLSVCPQDIPNMWGQNSMAPAMFLVAARPDIAAKLMQQNPYLPGGTFVGLAGSLLRAKWTHAIAAFSRADDESALNLVQELASLSPVYEKEAQRILASGIPQTPAPNYGYGGAPEGVVFTNGRSFNSGSSVGSPFMYQIRVPRYIPGGSQTPTNRTAPVKQFGFLDQAPSLVADIKRRLAESPQDLRKRVTNAHEVPIAIASLEDAVGDITWQNRGPERTLDMVPLSNIAGTLGRSEDSAIPALIDCFQNDNRLSRDIAQDGQNPAVVPVRDLAIQAFCEITHTPMFPGDDAATLAGMKSWWVHNKGVSKPMREYRVLADDHATPEAWIEAATLIAPPNSQWFPGSTPQRPPVTEYEGLRDHLDPSVTQLLSKRIMQLVKTAQSNAANPAGPGRLAGIRQWSPPSVDTAKQLCENLWSWDPQSSLAPLQAASNFAYQQWQKKWLEDQGRYMDPQLLQLFEHRVELKDPTAMAGFKMLVCLDSQIGAMNADSFHYFYQHRDEPRFHGFAQTVFLEPVLHPKKSQSANRIFGNGEFLADQVADSPLLAVPEVRQAVLKLLQDKTVIGMAVNDGKMISIKSLDGSSMRGMGAGGDELAPGLGQKLPFRTCDQTMQNVAQLKGVPPFQPYWPLDVKDGIIKKTIDLIKAHQNDEVALLSWPNNWQASPNSQGGGTPGGFGQPGNKVAMGRG